METREDVGRCENLNKPDVIDRLDSCMRRAKIARELLLEGLAIGQCLPEGACKQQEMDRAYGYFEAAIDILDIALMEYKGSLKYVA